MQVSPSGSTTTNIYGVDADITIAYICLIGSSLSKAVHACGKTSCHQHVCRRGRLCACFAYRGRGCAPPNPHPPLFEAIHIYGKGKVVRIILHANCRGLCPPRPPGLSKSIRVYEKGNQKNHVIAIIAARGGG